MAESNIPEEAFYAFLANTENQEPAGTRFQRYVELLYAVLHEYGPSEENDRRQNALQSSIEQSGLSFAKVIQRAQRGRKNRYGVIEYSREQIEEIEVLVDALDEHKKRWFIAWHLVATHYAQNGGLYIPERIHQRIIDGLGEQPEHKEFSLWRRAYEALKIAAKKPPHAINQIEPKKMWVCLGYLFDDEESACAYADFIDILRSKEQ